MARAERLFDLLDLLRTRRRPMTADAMAAALGVSSRSVYRDIDALRALGASIDGEAGIGYRLRPGFLLPPLMLTPDELDALTLGATWVRQRADPALAGAADAALAKIAAVLPDPLQVPSIAPPLVTAVPVAHPPDPVSTAILREAIKRQRKLLVAYRDAEDRHSERTLWPIAIAYFDEARVLAAWCEMRGTFRHFRVDRLREVTMLDEAYTPRRDQLFRQWREQDRIQTPCS